MKNKFLICLLLALVLCAMSAITVQADWSPDVTFSTVDQNGTTRTESIFANKELTMLNLWGYWDEACVRELPTLQMLNNNFADLQVYGVSLSDYEADNVQAMSDAGVSLPLLQLTDSLNSLLNTGYIPAAVFVDSDGHVVSDVYVCSRSYDEWAETVQGLLGED